MIKVGTSILPKTSQRLARTSSSNVSSTIKKAEESFPEISEFKKYLNKETHNKRPLPNGDVVEKENTKKVKIFDCGNADSAADCGPEWFN